MIKVSVLYPKSDKFDWDYYLAKHTALCERLLKPALKQVAVSKGVAGGAPGAPATYEAICDLHFDSLEAFQSAMGPNAKEIMGDIKNYTDARPVMQISEVKM